MKRIWSILLTAVLLFTLTVPAAAAENTASTMRLMEKEGTVSAENSAGKALSVWNGMRLYSGYEVATKAASYAYIALDNSKTAKLDASSSAKVAQSGKQLELNLTTGSMFFNVPVALKSGESLDIRTSNMVTGIRGTAGYVRVLDRYTTRVALLEGTATIHSRDPLTGANRSVTISGGQVATIILHERAAAMEQQLIRDGVIIEENIVEPLTELGQVVEELQEEGVPGFAAAEVAKDSDLQERIENESPLDPQQIARSAPAKLEREQKEAAAEGASIDEELQATFANDTPRDTEVFTEPETIVVTDTTVIEVETEVIVEKEVIKEVEVEKVVEVEKIVEVEKVVEVEKIVKVETEVKVEKPTLNTDQRTTDVVKTALNEEKVATATNSALDLAGLDVGKDETLNVVGGTLSNTGDAVIGGTVNVFGNTTFQNNGTITITSKDSLHLYSTLTNYGNIVIGDSSNPGTLVVEPGGKLENYGSITVVGSDSSFVIKGDYYDEINEVIVTKRDGTVAFLGSFRDAQRNIDFYDGATFRLLDAGTLSSTDEAAFDPSTSITLDLNGKEADLIGYLPDDLAAQLGIDTWTGIMLMQNISPVSGNSSSSNFTIVDSVGGGELNGDIIVSNFATAALESGTVNGTIYIEDGYAEITGGTLVVPSNQFGVTIDSDYYGTFYMSAGIIDATARGAYALDYYDGSSCTLEGGRLYGKYLTPNGAVYRYSDNGDSTLYIPGSNSGSGESSGSYEDGYEQGYIAGLSDTYYYGYSDGYYDGFDSFADSESDGGDSESGSESIYDNPYDAGDEYGEATGETFDDGYDDGYRDGQSDGYSNGYQIAFDLGVNDAANTAEATGTYGEGFRNAYGYGYDNGYSDGFNIGQMSASSGSGSSGSGASGRPISMYSVRFYVTDDTQDYSPVFLYIRDNIAGAYYADLSISCRHEEM